MLLPGDQVVLFNGAVGICLCHINVDGPAVRIGLALTRCGDGFVENAHPITDNIEVLQKEDKHVIGAFDPLNLCAGRATEKHGQEHHKQ